MLFEQSFLGCLDSAVGRGAVLGGVVEVMRSIPTAGHKLFFSIYGIVDLLYLSIYEIYGEWVIKYFSAFYGHG